MDAKHIVNSPKEGPELERATDPEGTLPPRPAVTRRGPMSNQWFDVDKEGLRKLIEERGKGRLVAELIQNALDEDVKRIAVNLTAVPGRPLAALSVEDDSPEGFRELAHAYTLFAESYKKGLPEKRGRFNLGEKLVLAMCEEATISTTTGAVHFDAEGNRHTHPRRKRACGSLFEATVRMTRDELADACTYLRGLLLPEGVAVALNGEALLPRIPVHAFEASLFTDVADEEGVLRRRLRKTRVELFEPGPQETAGLYELGLPVVETGDRWHVNVCQKVPLNMDRDNVPPAYLRSVRTAIFNEMHERLTGDDITAAWVEEATSQPDCSAEAIRAFADLRFGKDRASYDPTDTEAVKAIQSRGGTVVTGSMLNKEQWANLKKAQAIEPAGKILPTAKPYSLDPNAPPAYVVPPEQWTDGMRNVAGYAAFLAGELMGVSITVAMVKTTNHFSACYGSRRLDFNLSRLGHGWFDRGVSEELDALLIHEFGHEYSGDHLSHEYHEALCKLAARLKRLAMEKPDQLWQFATRKTATS
jgi:hypothetical protein